MLHVTNGSATVESLEVSGIPGAVLPWRDVLHEGPVPAGLSRQELGAVRARFIGAQGWAKAAAALRDFEQRDAALERWREHGSAVLWFEHDLYDQLQLIQVLDFFCGEEPREGTLELICIDRHPEVERFYGLGQLSPEQLAALFELRRPVTRHQLELGRSAWRAFRDPTPTEITRRLEQDTSALPFLAAALERHLEQFPSVRDGLGRTERQILEGVASGLDSPGDLFRDSHEREESPFLGDLVFWDYIARLSTVEQPLLSVAKPSEASPFTAATITLTEAGRRVLEGGEDRIRLNAIDLWLGGVRLSGRDVWRWDPAAGLVKP